MRYIMIQTFVKVPEPALCYKIIRYVKRTGVLQFLLVPEGGGDAISSIL